MRRPVSPFQFGLLQLFGWVVALSALFALARAPWPVNSLVVPPYAGFLAGVLVGRSSWAAAFCGGLVCAALFLVFATVPVVQGRQDALLVAIYSLGCYLPIGAGIGLAGCQAMRDVLNSRRFKTSLRTLQRETTRAVGPDARAQSESER